MYSEQIRDVLTKHARLGENLTAIADDTDLYGVGLTSLTTVNVMLALEDHFNVEFPEKMLGRKTFQSIRTLSEAIQELTAN
jgi:acyl carrier protein